MISVRNERVVSFSLEYQDVFWEVEPHREDIQEYRFYVDRSESEAGPWQTIAGPLIDRYYLRDSNFPAITLHRVLFYRIRVVNQLSGKETTSTTFSRRGELPLDALEIIRNEQVLFREFVGARCWLFPRRSFGQSCPQCWDSTLRKKVDDSCRTCWGTGFSGGYHYPVKFWGQVDQNEKQEQVSSQSHQQTAMVTMRCGPTPFIKPLDLIIDHQNKRYRVVTVGGTTRLGIVVKPELRLQMIQKGSIEDAIPLRVDLEEEQLVPDRVFTNPHTLDAEKDLDTSFLSSLYR